MLLCVWCVCYDKRGGNHCLLPSTQRWRASQRVDLLESVKSSHTSSTSFLSHLFREERNIWFLPFFYLLSEDIRAPTWVNETLGCLCHGGCSHPHQTYNIAMKIGKPVRQGAAVGTRDDWEEQNDVHCWREFHAQNESSNIGWKQWIRFLHIPPPHQ